MSRTDISRGDIWWLDWSPGRGSEQTGVRPGLVVQADGANHNPRYPNVIVLALTRQGRAIPAHVRLDPSPTNGLRDVSFVKCEQLHTADKGRLERRMGRVTGEEMARIERGLHLVLDL